MEVTDTKMEFPRHFAQVSTVDIAIEIKVMARALPVPLTPHTRIS